tara:strand:+ start:151 stop:441 length:291 start_codon:yes stop_codon:yes gene_type:complete
MAGKFKQFAIKPNVLSSNGLSIDKVSLNIGTVEGTQGPIGPQGANGSNGSQGPSGNPDMLLTSPNGSVYKIIVDDSGNLSTTAISTPGQNQQNFSS